MNKKTLNKKKAIYGALGFGALIAVALPIFAGAGGGCGEKGHGFGKLYGMSMMNDRMITKLSRKLDLETSQRDALFAAADEARPLVREMREQMHQSRRAMREYDPKAADYREKVADLAKKHSELAHKMTLMVADLKTTLVEVLTEQQMQKLKEVYKNKRQNRHKKHHDDDE